MAIHLYLDEALTQQISEGDFSRPEAESYNGTPNALMTFSLTGNEAIHNPGPVALGMFRDMGWVLNNAPPPGNQTLTVAKAGTGTGTVTSSPVGVNCGLTCSALFSFAAIHLDELIRKFADRGLVIVCDRQGGREHYGGLLRLMFEDWELSIESESEELSDYRLHPIVQALPEIGIARRQLAAHRQQCTSAYATREDSRI